MIKVIVPEPRGLFLSPISRCALRPAIDADLAGRVQRYDGATMRSQRLSSGRPCPRREVGRYLSEVEILPPVQAGSVRTALHDGFRPDRHLRWLFRAGASNGVAQRDPVCAVEGACVYGSSSIALRAAEPHPMIGVGAIFEAYRDGELRQRGRWPWCTAPAEQGFAELLPRWPTCALVLVARARSEIIPPEVEVGATADPGQGAGTTPSARGEGAATETTRRGARQPDGS